MTRDEIITLAREAGMVANTDSNGVNALGHFVPVAWLERFAALIEARTESALAAAEARNATLTDEAARWRYVAYTLGDYCVVDAIENTIGVLKGSALDAVVDAAIQARAAASISTKEGDTHADR